jgi:hypothetical protein
MAGRLLGLNPSNRGSICAASIVSTTTAAKNGTPGPAAPTSAAGLHQVTTKASTKTSSMDQRPMVDHAVQPRALAVAADRAALYRDQQIASAISFPSGIMTLATTTISANGQDPER